MPIKSRQTAPVPEVSVPSFLFGSTSEPLPDEPIILDPASPDTDFLTLSTYRRWSQRFAASLQHAGFQKGDKLLLVAGNAIAYPVIFMGTLMAGGILSGASPTLTLEQLTRQAAQVKPKFIVASEDGYDLSLKAANAISLSDEDVFLFGADFLHDSARSEGKSVMPLIDKDVDFDWTELASPDDMAVINFTSGSSGHSKGVLVSHRNLVANAAQYIEQQKANPFGPENNKDATWVMWTPMYHVIGQNQYCIIAPKRGLRNYVMSKFDLNLLLQYAEQFKATELILLPPIVIALLHSPLMAKYDLSSVTTGICGGAPIRESVIKAFEDLMPNPAFTIVQGWGMTEMTCLGINSTPSEFDRNTTGQLMPNCEAMIRTPDGERELGPNEPGELWIRGPNVAQGYWQLPELSAATYVADGWLRTGDFGYYDEQQRFQIRDRVQDIIHAPDGAYALPTDLESILIGIPGVKDAGITSVTSDPNSKTSVPRAFVALEPEANIENVRDMFNEKVKPHETLRGGIFEIKEVPRLPSGKVNRVGLRQMDVGGI